MQPCAVPLLIKKAGWLALPLMLPVLLPCFGCDRKPEAEDIRPVRTITVENLVHTEVQVLPGLVAAHKYVNASFKISGRLAARSVSAGSSVKAGQLLARLNEEIETNTLTAANAEIAAAKAALDQAASVARRAAILLRTKAVSQNEFDEASRQLKSARAMMQAAEAKARSAREQLGYTSLHAPADGIVTDTFAEPGEVVAAGHPIVRLAEAGTVDAVFNAPADFIRKGLRSGQSIETCLEDNQTLCAKATIYEIAPEADPVTRTHLTKTSIENPPPQILLGDTVSGRIAFSPEQSIKIPATALTSAGAQAAVWVINQPGRTVSLRPVTIGNYTTDGVVVASGLSPGEMVVTAGVQALHQGQKVSLQADGHEKH